MICAKPPDDCGLCEEKARETTAAFLGTPSAVRWLLDTDVRAAWEGDPAVSRAIDLST
jgi:hypothetical protein